MTWVAGGGATRAVEELERGLEDGRERQGMIEAAGLHLAVDRGKAARRRDLYGVAVG